MTTIHSLVCWGGKTGKTVTFTDAGDVVNLSYHGLRDGMGVVFTDNAGNTLPTGLSKNVTYYAKSTALGTFTLWTTSALTTQVTFTGTGTGTHIAKGAYYVGLADKSRWTYSSVEYIYDGVNAWNSGRAAALFSDVEVCELGEAFTENTTTSAVITVPSGTFRIESKINGVRTAAFHNGLFNAGFILTVRASASSAYCLSIPKAYCVADGFTCVGNVGGYYSNGISIGNLATALNMIIVGLNTSNGNGFTLAGTYSKAENCIAVNWSIGFSLPSYVVGITVVGCTVAKNGTGFYGVNYQPTYLTAYNNIVIGNTTNFIAGVYGFTSCTNNAGLSGQPWTTSGGTAVVMATTDFASFGSATYASTDNFAPASSSSPQVETATEFYGALPYDIKDAVRPSYKGGAAAYRDIGAFEFDQNYGPWPASHILTLTNVVVGSRILIRDQADTTTHYSADAAASTVVIPITVYSDSRDNWRIRIRKATASTFYQPYETLMTATAGESSLYISQIPD